MPHPNERCVTIDEVPGFEVGGHDRLRQAQERIEDGVPLTQMAQGDFAEDERLAKDRARLQQTGKQDVS